MLRASSRKLHYAAKRINMLVARHTATESHYADSLITITTLFQKHATRSCCLAHALSMKILFIRHSHLRHAPTRHAIHQRRHWAPAMFSWRAPESIITLLLEHWRDTRRADRTERYDTPPRSSRRCATIIIGGVQRQRDAQTRKHTHIAPCHLRDARRLFRARATNDITRA